MATASSAYSPPPGGQLPALELRHRRHARVEDRIRAGKTPACATSPFHDFAQNQVWLAIAALAADLLAWCTRLALPASAATYEPKRRWMAADQQQRRSAPSSGMGAGG